MTTNTDLAKAHGASTRTVIDTGRTVIEFYTDELDAYTRAAIQQAAVPEGFKLVPVEATPEMLAASPAPPKQQDCVSQNAESEAQAILMRADAPQEQPEAPLSMSMFASRADFDAATKQQPALGRGDGGGVPLSDDEIRAICKAHLVEGYSGDYLEDDGFHLARAVEAAHGIKEAS